MFIRRTCSTLECWLARNLLVGTADDGIVWLERVIGAERDHKPGFLIGSHPDNLGSLLDAKELVGFGIRNAKSGWRTLFGASKRRLQQLRGAPLLTKS